MYTVLISGGLTVSAADLVPTVDWAMAALHGAPPANLSNLIAGAIVMAIHAGSTHGSSASNPPHPRSNPPGRVRSKPPDHSPERTTQTPGVIPTK